MSDKKVKIMTRYGKVVPDDDPPLAGYTGKSKVDSGYFYCPYVPLATTGVFSEEEVLKREIKDIENEKKKARRRRRKNRV